MVVFHLFWDLNYFNFLQISLYNGFFGLLQKSAAGLFLFLVGICLTLSYNKRKETFRMHFFKRGVKVFSAGLLITLFTLIFFSKQFIFFGVLHLISFSIILSIPLIKRKKFNLLLATAIILLSFLLTNFPLQFPFLVFLWHNFPIITLDYFPIIPWFSVILLGIVAGNHFYAEGKQKFKIKKINSLNFMNFLGKHSLLIYFLHQPILISIILLFKSMFPL